MMYALVRYLDTQLLEVVPRSWTQGGHGERCSVNYPSDLASLSPSEYFKLRVNCAELDDPTSAPTRIIKIGRKCY